MTSVAVAPATGLDTSKFRDPDVTADGQRRASVALTRMQTLWFNTGTLCNLTCANCYIESSPRNDRLVYLTAAEVSRFLDELEAEWGSAEIGFTGGEPFMNPELPAMLEDALARGHHVLVLTNAMRPMLKRKSALIALKARHGRRLTLRVSVDHYGQALHEAERGRHSWRRMLEGLTWLGEQGFNLKIAGRTFVNEGETELRAGYARLFAELGLPFDAGDPDDLVLFPEMDEDVDVPEITDACWSILGVDPGDMMCATSRMVVKRKGADAPTVLPCTLLPYDEGFELGTTLEASLSADGGMFDRGKVKLNHPPCSKFCVLGGGSCSAKAEE